MLAGLDRRLEAETSLPVNLVEAPLECVVLGAGKCLAEFDAVHDLFMK
jgi:rod shape-determining protein MreB